jgi:hypothetical protein
MDGNPVRTAVNQRHALQDARYRRADGADETAAERSRLSVAIDTAWLWVVAVWVRIVAGAVWSVTAFYVGLLLDAAGVPVAEAVGAVVAAVPFVSTVGSGAPALLATAAFPLGMLWTLRGDDRPTMHRRRLIALSLLVTLPVVLQAVELILVGTVNTLLSQGVGVPQGSVRAFYHVATTLAIAFGAAFLWYHMKTEPSRSRWSTYY